MLDRRRLLTRNPPKTVSKFWYEGDVFFAKDEDFVDACKRENLGIRNLTSETLQILQGKGWEYLSLATLSANSRCQDRVYLIATVSPCAIVNYMDTNWIGGSLKTIYWDLSSSNSFSVDDIPNVNEITSPTRIKNGTALTWIRDMSGQLMIMTNGRVIRHSNHDICYLDNAYESGEIIKVSDENFDNSWWDENTTNPYEYRILFNNATLHHSSNHTFLSDGVSLFGRHHYASNKNDLNISNASRVASMNGIGYITNQTFDNVKFTNHDIKGIALKQPIKGE